MRQVISREEHLSYMKLLSWLSLKNTVYIFAVFIHFIPFGCFYAYIIVQNNVWSNTLLFMNVSNILIYMQCNLYIICTFEGGSKCFYIIFVWFLKPNIINSSTYLFRMCFDNCSCLYYYSFANNSSGSFKKHKWQWMYLFK